VSNEIEPLSTPTWRIAVDTGGTFTDVVCFDGERLREVKVPSTPDDPARAVLEGIARVLPDEGVAYVLLHGSTVATNALLERKGARVALITNAGFEDVLEIGRQNRPQLYALAGYRPPPLVPRDARHGVAGRLGPRGEVIEPLVETELAGLAARLGSVESVAICLLHSYADDTHERRVEEALAGTGLPVSRSSHLLPEFREYERTATTVVNAYVAPVMDRYLGRIEAESGALRVRIMGSGGGVMAVSRARIEAVHTILSGPAGGVAGALAAARRAGFENALTFDMGGTSTDVSLCPGRPLHTREFRIADLPVAVSMLDIHTVGAGGGSIARVDAGGALRVGPESAGAEPGPICYGRGGTDVTVTDANVWLGRLPADAWRHELDGGAARLDRDAIEAPLRRLAGAMGASLDDAAEGVITVVNTSMEGALRVISVERGHDPAEYTLVCFGGAAALHGTALATRLGTPRVLVPPSPGLLSAYGMLVAPVRKEASRTVLLPARRESGAALDAEFAALEARALAAMGEEDIDRADVVLERQVDARYEGQSYELTVAADGWIDAFHAAHETRYGYRRDDAVVQAVSLRVAALAPASAVPGVQAARAEGGHEERRIRVRHGGARVEARLLERATLRAGNRIEGPAVIAEYSATTWLPPEWRLEVLEDGSLLAEAGRG
jgi:N-methylhydantoinase A